MKANRKIQGKPWGPAEMLPRVLLAIVAGSALGTPISCGGSVSSGAPQATGGMKAGGGGDGDLSSGDGDFAPGDGGTSPGDGDAFVGDGDIVIGDGDALVGDGDGAALCRVESSAAEFCLSPDQMESQARYGYEQSPLDPPRSDDDIAAGWQEDGCMRHDWMGNGCCNPAQAPGSPNDEGKCCYVACTGVCCGRPLIVDEQSQVSLIEERADWCDDSPQGPPHSLETRLASILACAFRSDALLEHASVASFARFSLQLLSLGAPADLVGRAARAIQEEVSHARGCFRIAHYLDQQEQGPGTLTAACAQLSHDWRAVLVALIREGCVGETVSAALARKQAELAGDPLIKEELGRIAEDEQRHAELAWRSAAWVVRTFGQQARMLAKVTFTRALLEPPHYGAIEGVDEQLLNRYGRLSSEQAADVTQVCVNLVLRPAADALCARGGSTLSAPAWAASSQRSASLGQRDGHDGLSRNLDAPVG